jgi:hypothetical protein
VDAAPAVLPCLDRALMRERQPRAEGLQLLDSAEKRHPLGWREALQLLLGLEVPLDHPHARNYNSSVIAHMRRNGQTRQLVLQP